jgi:DNA-binding Xre family transcriptional regulator
MGRVRLQVKELAETQGLNISQLTLQANRLTPGAKLSYPTVHALWHNRTQRPDLGTLAAIARALGVQPGELLVVDSDP